jgi:phage antirepressor YoqD-like protein
MNNNRPYQKYIDSGYFRVIEQKYMKNGEEHINFKTLVYQRGLDFIRKMVCKEIAS